MEAIPFIWDNIHIIKKMQTEICQFHTTVFYLTVWYIIMIIIYNIIYNIHLKWKKNVDRKLSMILILLYLLLSISFLFSAQTHIYMHTSECNTPLIINDCTAKIELDRTCCFPKWQFLILLSNYQELLWQKQQDFLFIVCVSIVEWSPIKQQTALHTLQDHAAISSCSAVFSLFHH